MFIKTNRYDWTIKNSKKVKAISFVAIQRALQLRFASKTQNNIFSLSLRLDKKVAKAAADLIPIESTHLVISQNLLPFIWEQGVLGGRTFDVLMSRLPIEKLHQRLDIAHKQFPESKTLNDFRASQTLIDLENIALTKSRHIITPHKEIADTFNNKSIKLVWTLPTSTTKQITGNKILFPASSLGRKGAYDIKRLAKELNLSVVLIGQASEDNNFWNGVTTEFAKGNPFDNVCLVVYPTYVEHQPRLLLKAIATGIPVITTPACGLSPTDNLIIIPFGDYEILKQTVKEWKDKKTESLRRGLL
ncbi:MAG: hypothetical protein IPJ26_05095 [Bacteroidetes bacterium]|nr:hypothetical protein [Bacteroidota bacterium]